MTDKQFPPAQALRAVPLEAAHRLKHFLFRDVKVALAAGELIEFVEQFRPQALPEMTVAGGFNEVTITDETVNAEMLDLIRINGRVFSPEIIEVDGGPLPASEREELLAELEAHSSSYDDVRDLMERAAIEIRSLSRLDEDDLEQIISDSLDMDWKPRDAARAIHAELYGKGEE